MVEEQGIVLSASFYAIASSSSSSSSNMTSGGGEEVSAALLLEAANHTLGMSGRLHNPTNGKTANNSEDDSAAYDIFADVVANIALPVIIVLGIGVNTTVSCLLHHRPRRDSIHVYLDYLSLVNGLILVSGSGYTWLCIVTEVRPLVIRDAIYTTQSSCCCCLLSSCFKWGESLRMVATYPRSSFIFS